VAKFESQSTDLAEEHDLYDNKVHLQDVMKAIVTQVRCPREALVLLAVISPPLAACHACPAAAASLKPRQCSRELVLCRTRRSNR